MRLLYITLAFVVVAALAAWVVGDATNGSILVDWAPNVATEALSILVTVAVVQQLLERRDRDRAKKRTAVVHNRIEGELTDIGRTMVQEYADTHRNTFRMFRSRRVSDIISHWTEGLGTADEPPGFVAEDAVRSLDLTREILEQHRTRDADLLSHDLLAALDQFLRNTWIPGFAFDLAEARRDKETGNARRRRAGLEMLATGTDALLTAFEQEVTRILEVDQSQFDRAIEWHHVRFPNQGIEDT